MREFVLPFKKISKKNVSIAGGKGAQLGEMFNAGIPVPDGFVVLTPAFELFIEEAGLREKIVAELKKVDAKKTASVDKASKKIREMLKKAKMPKKVQEKIIQEFKKLNVEFVAVRSSATAEDSSKASWAGELETYTHVTKKDLLEKVKKCWSSLFTPRAIFYRISKNLSHTDIAVAVVVQKMVESEVSGVSFTVDPVSNDKNKIIIEAAFGLGESIVSGAVTPDRYVVEKKDEFIENITVNPQQTMLSKVKGKTTKKSVPKEKQETQKLEGKKIIELAKICKKIESHYKFPQDIEWGLEKGKLFILQTRPITTLK